MKAQHLSRPYFDEGVPTHADIGRAHPMVVFGDHRLCAGQQLAVRAMPRPHMHSQVEMNFVIEGSMTYWFDGRIVTLEAGDLALFWGMVPHQVTRAPEITTFACFYVPISLLLELSSGGRLRDALLRGAIARAAVVRPHEKDVFLQWRDELLAEDGDAGNLARDELIARLRRLDREGWTDLRVSAPLSSSDRALDAERMVPIELMSRFIGERARQNIRVSDVARVAGLHPNYAMNLFKRAIGISIKQAIIRHRLDAAQAMLIGSDRSVLEIAYDCGFGSLSSFYDAFERRFTTSPLSFRRAMKTTIMAEKESSAV